MASSHTRLQQLRNRLEAISKIANQLQQLDQRFFWYRLSTFAGAWVFAILARFLLPGIVWLYVLVGMIILFLVVVFYHRRLDQTRVRYKNAQEFFGQQVARASLDWNEIPNTIQVESDPEHPYMNDINLVGDRSLLQLIDSTATKGGQKQLLEWFLKAPQSEKIIQDRQKLVKEIVGLPGFRNGFILSVWGMKQGKEALWDDKVVRKWINSASNSRQLRRLLFLLGSLAILNYTLLALNLLAGWLPLWQFSLIAYFAIYFFQSRNYETTFQQAYQISKDLEPLQAALVFLEKYPASESSSLQRLLDHLHQSSQRPSGFLKKIVSISSAASLQNNQILSLLVNAILPWDVIFATILDIQKQKLNRLLSDWLNTLYIVEGLVALANFAYLNPDYTFPFIQEARQSPLLVAKSLGHPLIEKTKKVVNDFQFSEIGEVALISGSNMSGKSTFLRTLGVNLVLAYAGTVANANQFNVPLLRLFTCIQVSDSLKDGFSYFYAEVRRLRRLLEWLKIENQEPVFYLIDEIFQGTNHEERRIGSLAYLSALVDAHGIGAISTHDIELSKLAEEQHKIHNINFQDAVVNNRMSFDYILRPGPSPTTNALKIMAMEGLPVDKHRHE